MLACGFLIVPTFDAFYEEYRYRTPRDQVVYSIPREGTAPADVSKKYRGIDRNALSALPPEAFEDGEQGDSGAASVAMWRLRDEGKSDEGFIFSIEDTRYVYSLLREHEKWEIVWAADTGAGAHPPSRTQLLGFEPTWFIGDHFSAVSDSMCFPAWHGPDEEGTLFRPYHDRLNRNGLFDTQSDAEEFIRFYTSFDWTETGPYVIAEIRSVSE